MLIGYFFLGNILLAQDPPQYGTPFYGVPYRMDANIYQMNLREYSNTRDINGARANLQRISDLGINVLYLMPVFPVSSDSRASGSPYANTDYKSVAPDLGTLEDLRGLVEDAHNLGMAVILDFIVNQTGWDHPWVSQHPEWYLTDGGGSILSPCPTPDFCFNDVAGIDLNNSDARAAMIDAMRYWVFAANIDGFRFDWADQAPQTFWTEAVNNLRGITTHDLLLLAEGSNEGSSSGCTSCGDNQPGAHYQQGFDYIFGTNFYWNVMKKVWDSGEPVLNLDGVTEGEYNGADATQLVARFLSNHDDYNAEGSPFSFLHGGRNGVMAAFVLATYHRSVPFIYNGIEVGNTSPLPYPWNSGTINWTQDLTVYNEMQDILIARNNSMALKRGIPVSYINPDNSNPNVFAFIKESGGEKVAVLVNSRGSHNTFEIPSGMAGTYNDIFTPSGEPIVWTEGQSISLSAYQYIVLTNADVPDVEATGVSMSPENVSVNAGLTQTLIATVLPANATNKKVFWSSDNLNVATVNPYGEVTAVNPGIATITVRTEDGGFTDQCLVTVTESSSFEVFFHKPETWSTSINIYWWSAQPEGVLAENAWPGVPMTNVGDGWYSYTFTNVSNTNLIFNDGINQTIDLSRGQTGWYRNGTWYDSAPDLCTPTTIIPYTQVNNTGWSQVASASLTAGGSVGFGPHPLTGGAWEWSGPNGFNATEREVVFNSVQVTHSGEYVAQYTNPDGCASTQTFTLNVSSVDQTPYHGTPVAIPGTVQAEDFDYGGEGLAYSDSDVVNNGGEYRTNEAVDIEVCSEGGFNVGWVNSDEWLEYTVDVNSTGIYSISIQVASPVGSSFHIEFDGIDKTGDLIVPNTGGWQNWQTITANNIELSAGIQTIRIYMDEGGFNMNSFDIYSESVGTYFALQNRWLGTYLFDAGNNVGYGNGIENNSFLWERVEVEPGYFLLRNIETEQYMHIEDQTGITECSDVDLGWWSAHWSFDYIEGDWMRMRNRWQSGNVIHVENQSGNAQYGNIEEGWHSAQWKMITTSYKNSGAVSPTSSNEKIEVVVYPNPTSGNTISISGLTVNARIQLIDLNGRILQELRADDHIVELDISGLVGGVYFVKAVADQNVVIRELFVE